MPTNAGPDTNRFRCNACGRYLNDPEELREHDVECRTAKVSTDEGRRQLEREDSHPHQPNDHESTWEQFKHGTRNP